MKTAQIDAVREFGRDYNVSIKQDDNIMTICRIAYNKKNKSQDIEEFLSKFIGQTFTCSELCIKSNYAFTRNAIYCHLNGCNEQPSRGIKCGHRLGRDIYKII